MSDESPVRIEKVTSVLHEIERMNRAKKVSAEIVKALEAGGLKDWSFMMCAWLPGEQPIIVAGTRVGCDLMESVKDGALWILKCIEAKTNGDQLPVVTGRPGA